MGVFELLGKFCLWEWSERGFGEELLAVGADLDDRILMGEGDIDGVGVGSNSGGGCAANVIGVGACGHFGDVRAEAQFGGDGRMCGIVDVRIRSGELPRWSSHRFEPEFAAGGMLVVGDGDAFACCFGWVAEGYLLEARAEMVFASGARDGCVFE